MQTTISTTIGNLFSLKHVFFSTFDSSSLENPLNKTQERVLMIAKHHANTSMQFLSRERDDTDRRSFTIIVTTAGACRAEQIDALFRNHLETLLGKLTTEDRHEFEKAARSLSRLIPILASRRIFT